MQLADVGALRQTRALAASQHSEGAGDMVQRLPRKLLEKTAAQMAVNQGDSAAQLALRVTDMSVTRAASPRAAAARCQASLMYPRLVLRVSRGLWLS